MNRPMRKLLAALAATIGLGVGASAATINLDTVESNTTVQDGDVLIGALTTPTPSWKPKLSIAAGATVTISNTVIIADTKEAGTYHAGYDNIVGTMADVDWAGLTCLGNATIILKGANTVYGCQSAPAIYVPESRTLTIKGTGSLTALGGDAAAGIGGGLCRPCGSIVIEGGTITARGRSGTMSNGGGAGIGGGISSRCGNITITGGYVNATAFMGAGIGSGNGGSCGNISISGGQVYINESVSGEPAIGSGEDGSCGYIEITGGDVIAFGGPSAAGIGTGRRGTCGDITLAGDEINAAGGANGAGVGSGRGGECGRIRIMSSISKVTVSREDGRSEIIGAGNAGNAGTIVQESGIIRTQYDENHLVFTWDGNLASRTRDAFVYNGMSLYGTLPGNYKLSVKPGATVTLAGATIDGFNNSSCKFAGINLLGNATLRLADGTANTVKGFYEDWPGIHVPEGSTLTITGGGTLTASSNGYGAGIGGGYNIPCGSIIINGGDVTATGGNYAAGIGGGYQSVCGSIQVNAGIKSVVATSGINPLGQGANGPGGAVSISSGLNDTTSNGGKTRTITPVWDGNLSTLDSHAIAYDGMTITGTLATKSKVSIADGATITLKAIDITVDDVGNDQSCKFAGLTCLGNATIILEGISWVSGFYEDYPGIYVPPNKTLTIKGGGSLDAWSNGYGAGIGGGYNLDCGSIDIQGGFVDAEGGTYCAGIGGGYNGACGSIHIAAGVAKVRAKCGNNTSTPIGAGGSGSGGAVSVDSGVKDVTSGSTRTITWGGDLSVLTGDATAIDGTVIHGTLGVGCKVSVAAGASVTLSNAVIRGGTSPNSQWAGLTCEGGATITLVGDNTVTSFHEDYPGIYVPANKALYINGSGSLFASGGSNGAGIGGGRDIACGSISISGGIIKAVGQGGSAGIGGGEGASCGNITVNPGVTYIQAWRGADGVSAIGAGRSGSVGTVAVTGVGTSLTDVTSSGGSVRIISWNGDLSQVSKDRTAYHGMTLYNTLAGNCKISIEPGATVTLSNAVIRGTGSTSCEWAGLTCLGDATINLAAGTSSTVKGFYENYPGIYVPTNKTLTVTGEGSLTASSGVGDDVPFGAGIGGGYKIPCGNIVIESGTITANGGASAAGIGGGYKSACGTITISGGTITASSGSGGAGIGGGEDGACGTITIGQGITRVVATHGGYATPIGAGKNGTGGNVVLDGYFDDVTSGSTRTITPAWDGNLATLTDNATARDGMTIYGTLAANVKVSIADGATVTLSNAVINGTGSSSYTWAGLTCLGDATINLAAGTSSTVKGFYEDYPGIYVPSNKTLVVQGKGSLTASSNGWGAGIGGGYNLDCGNIIILQGTVTATGGSYAAGIGGGYRKSCGTIMIGGLPPTTLGGATVTATGGNYAAGIGGGGGSGSSCGDIAITGTETLVNATGGQSGAGIGGGQSCTVGSFYFFAGTTIAAGGDNAPGIGSGSNGRCGAFSVLSSITRITATCGTGCGNPIGAGVGGTAGDETIVNTLYDDHGSPTRTISHDAPPWDGNLATLTDNVTIDTDMTLYGTLAGNYKVSIADGTTVTLSNAVINGVNNISNQWAGITCLGDATINLAAGTSSTVRGFYEEYPGIHVPVGSTLTIGGSGSLSASSNGYGAGIGGGWDISCGSIVIEGGSITATGGRSGAGIGAGHVGNCGDITITGGSVTARGGNYAAGIGTGDGQSQCGNISIMGGSVTAIGGSNGAGIGSGDDSSSCGDITIGAGITRVEATCGSGAEPIGQGGGSSASCGEVTIAPGLTDDDGWPTQTITGGGSSGGYAAWAAANGVSGAWDAKDAYGIANVFRYAFNKPTGDVAILGIEFNEAGKAVIVTPPLVNSEGFAFTVVASDDIDGEDAVATTPLSASGRTVIDEAKRAKRFFRLRAMEE